MSYRKDDIIYKAQDVFLSYDRLILRDVNFEIHNIVRPSMEQGQVVSLIGRSGIGKTQLFKIMAGLIKPTSGAVLMNADLHSVIPGEVGVVPQNYILFNHRTVLENLRIALHHSSLKYTGQDKDKLINDYAATFDLLEHLKKYPMQLSGGQRQRVSIIQQILTGNRFILLDEPFSGLDAIVRDRVNELLIKISTLNELNTLVIVSHDIENSLAISDTAFVLAREPGKEGATITHTIDLVEQGLAWNPHIKEDRKFQELVDRMKHLI